MRRFFSRGEAHCTSFALRGATALALSFAASFAAGCAPPTSTPDPVGHTDEAIVNGVPATDYPEAIVIDWCQGDYCDSCSGSVIAPMVVLTAGHCVYGCADPNNDGSCPDAGQMFSGWRIRAPNANGQSAMGVSGMTYDYNSSADTVVMNEHDIGLIFLDQPITVAYPILLSQPVAEGTELVNIGRILNNQLTHPPQLYKGIPVSVRLGQQVGYPYDYFAQDIIQEGDSGGPDVINGTHQIAAVNSGGGQTEVLARVDLIFDWIQMQIQNNGGTGATGTTGAGATSGATTAAATGSGGSSAAGAGGASTESCDGCLTSAQSGVCAAALQTCVASTDCAGYLNCFTSCGGDGACEGGCGTQFPNGAPDFNAFAQCQQSTCAAECAMGAGGAAPAGAGGGSGQGGGSGDSGSSSSGCDCRQAPAFDGTQAPMAALAFVGLAFMRRRRRA